MHFSSLAVAALVGFAQGSIFARQEAEGGNAGGQKVHVVNVGRNPLTNQTAKKYFPDTVEAQQGEVVQFRFNAPGSMHTVTQSEFDTPCIQKSGGFNSGAQAVKSSSSETMVFNLVINDTKPIWVYCATGDHCKSKMVMVINEASAVKANSSRTGQQYAQLASEFNGKSTGGGSSTGNAGSSNGPKSSSSNVVAVPATVMLFLGAAFMLL
ncbi:hypothetical protein L249_6177 [Ophiocordyceps polyrhachis-furcata BCC 54312]|uniref:Phytocyanin domain-containing protein n=1 Tax=Ophiocordyceps polyrhachis-furcata BCC 54312 TaxID=1330021 RepID=A0A367LIJ5_9HYPO|nr:hypothetical protein L249_6177 [Ophiocordyceps polyrhachis-furcata BCC 54312]